jgi:hypothetical protein
MAKDSLYFAEKISSMVVNKAPYDAIKKELKDASDSNQALEWGVVGSGIVAIIQTEEHPFFIHMNLLDFAMQAFEEDGEDSILDRFQVQFSLANMYSDQAGLKRKFELYEDLVEGATSRMKKNSTEDPFYYWSTRSLNRLAQLTQYWKGEEVAEPLWHRLVKIISEAGEMDALLPVVETYAPWFIEANPELFPSHSD